jgi:5-methylcytosine-specific restriction endonuclease McrA
MGTLNKELNRKHQADWRARLSKEAKKEHDRLRYLRNKEKFNEQSTQWAKNNRHKSQASSHQATIRTKYPEAWASNDITTVDLAKWLKENRDLACPYCGDPASHIDHIVPLSSGGSHTWSNIELICKTCNMAKGTLSKSDFLGWIKKLSLRQPHLD